MGRTNLLLWGFVFLSFIFLASSGLADIEEGLVGHWKLDDGEDDPGSTIAMDSVGDHHGTLVNGPVWTDGALDFGGGLSFDGTDDRVEIPHSPDLTFSSSDSFTVATWVNVLSLPNNWAGVVNKSRDVGVWYGIWIDPSNSWVIGDVNVIGSTVTPGWYHVALVQDAAANTRTLYVDGQVDATGTAIDSTGTGDLWFGGAKSVTEFLNAVLDDVRIYNRVLSAEEITELMEWTGASVSAGPDQRVEGGTLVTLTGSGPPDATSFAWQQIIKGDEPVVTLSNPNSPTATFTPPAREIGYILTFRLTVASPTFGTTSDECLIYVTAPNEPKLAPGNFRAYPKHLGYRLQWDPLVDAEDYGVGFQVGPGLYFWFWTTETFYDLANLTEGQPTVIAVKARNQYGEGVVSDDMTLIPMRNYALPKNLGGTKPPSDYVYVISHFAITDMNDKEVEDDNNDSWDGLYKAEDYWGYLWPDPIYMDHVTYFTGDMFGDGAWFTSLKLQYTEDGVTWLDVPAQIVPPYEFADERRGRRTYERFDLFIPTVRGVGVRVYGTPGGSATFTTIAELEVFANATSEWRWVQGLDAEVSERGTATLDGSFTFSTRAITSYLWEQMSGPSVSITDATSAIATFDAPGVDEDTVLVFRLTASDGTKTGSDDDVRITVKNLVTTAVAGPDQGVKEGTTATLDGSGSTTTTGDITYQWTQTSGIPVTLDDSNSAICTFDAPIIWDYTKELIFRLDVNDGAGGTSSDETVVTIQNALAYEAWPYTDAAAPGTGYMTEMLHLGNNPTDRILAPLDIDLSTSDPLAKWGGQAFVNPVPGEAYDFTDTGFTVTRNPMVWTPIHDDAGWFGDEGLDYFQQMYHVYVISPDERAARLHARYDDEVRIWNNGTLIYSDNSWDLGSEHQADITLYEGLNSMTLKFEEGNGGNQIAVGFTDEFDSLMPDVWYSLGPSFVLADAYAVRALPTSYQAGGNLDIELSVRVNPDNKPSNVTISEPIPAGLTVVDAGGGTLVGGSLNWSFSGGTVATQVLSYTLGVPAGTSGALNFTGTVSFPTIDSIKGDKVIYEVPSAPQNLDVEMLLAANLSWSPSPEAGVVGYRVYRNVNGQGWEEAAFVSGNWFKDLDVMEGSSYNYQVAAVNAGGVEGPLSAESGGKSIKMQVVEAEDFNYGGGLYPGPGPDTVPALEAPALDDFGAAYDYYFQDTTYPDKPNVYRPKDDVDVREINPGQFIMGYTTVGDWWRYTVEAPAPGPSDPEGGWVKLELKVASPGGGTVDLYWDETLAGSLPFVTGSWGTYNTFPMEEQFQTTAGVHTLRVYFASGELDIDTIGMGFNWTKPTREDLFADDFETYTTLYSFADLVGAGYTVNNGSGVAEGAWRLWNTGGELLGNEDPAITAMTENYAITDSDLAGSVDADEELITPNIDCTSHRRVRLDFNMNYRAYPDDTAHLQIAEVDIRSSDDGVTWGNWVNLLRWSTSTVVDYATGAEQVDISAHADGKIVQVRWRFHEANFDYWFAIDNVRVSGDKENGQPPVDGPPIKYENGVAEIWWYAFGGGNYTVEYTADLTSGNWQPVPGATWPITATNWSGDITAIFARAVYLRVRSE